jgi:hypothetical protein
VNPITSWLKKIIADPMMTTMAQVTWFGFLLSAVFIAATVNIATSILLATVGSGWTLVVLLLLTALIVLYANLHQARLKQQMAKIEHTFTRPNPRPRRGLILMPTALDPAEKSIEYHKHDLAHVWAIETPAMRSNGDDLRDYIDKMNQEERRQIQYYRLPLPDEYDANACYCLVRDVFEQDAPKLGLLNNDVIADITGGTKIMSSAMALACADLGRPAQQVPALRRVAADISSPAIIPLTPVELAITRRAS